MRVVHRWIMLLCLAAGCGCASTHEADVRQGDDPYLEKGRVQWNSSNLEHLLVIEKLAADRTASGLLRVRMILRNKAKEDIWVDVRTTFLDDTRFPKEQTNWEPTCCTARTQTTYEAVSLGSQVADYQIIIRDPRKASDLP